MSVKTCRTLQILAFILFALAFLGTLLDLGITALINREGMIAAAHYSSLNGAVTFLTAFSIVPAEILMLLSMGGFFGKGTRS